MRLAGLADTEERVDCTKWSSGNFLVSILSSFIICNNSNGLTILSRTVTKMTQNCKMPFAIQKFCSENWHLVHTFLVYSFSYKEMPTIDSSHIQVLVPRMILHYFFTFNENIDPVIIWNYSTFSKNFNFTYIFTQNLYPGLFCPFLNHSQVFRHYLLAI